MRALLGGDGLDHLLGGGVWSRGAWTAWLLYLFGTLKLVHECRLTLTLHLLVGCWAAAWVRGRAHHHAGRTGQVLLRRHLRILLHQLLWVVQVDLMVHVDGRGSMRRADQCSLLAELWQLGV